MLIHTRVVNSSCALGCRMPSTCFGSILGFSHVVCGGLAICVGCERGNGPHCILAFEKRSKILVRAARILSAREWWLVHNHRFAYSIPVHEKIRLFLFVEYRFRPLAAGPHRCSFRPVFGPGTPCLWAWSWGCVCGNVVFLYMRLYGGVHSDTHHWCQSETCPRRQYE